ncbi:hypothetical protein [Pseudescherichia sp.]|uniref:hypothetical protein n=1 Tax=Pseudescherichia sp. TaxID=2055881 RepID=UPI0028A7B892|nr:hypothetical protein [Pseudescherichia sp.]
MCSHRLSAAATAKLIILNGHYYSEEKEKAITRYKISKATLRNLSGRQKIHESFLAEVQYELAEEGWMFVINNDDECCFMIMSTMNNWPKLSSKRIIDLSKKGEEEIDRVYLDYMTI